MVHEPNVEPVPDEPDVTPPANQDAESRTNPASGTRRAERLDQVHQRVLSLIPTRESLNRYYQVARIVVVAVDDVLAVFDFPTNRGVK